MKRNTIIAAVIAVVAGLGVLIGALTIPGAVARSNYQKGVEAEANEDMEAAIAYYEKAAKRHHVEALYRLGEIYAVNDVNWPEVVALLTEAYDRGKTEAGMLLGLAYMEGYGVEKDAKKAYDYALAAAEYGKPGANVLVGQMYENGIGTLRDEQKAFEYYQRSATQDNPTGQFYYARCYINGIGVARDQQKGKTLMEEASQNGSEDASNYLEQLRKEEKRKEQQRQREEKARREAEKAAKKHRCPACFGTGVTEQRYSNGEVRRSICFFCDGDGWI